MNPVATKRKTLPRKRLRRIPQWRQRRAAGLRILEAPQFAKLNWLVHGFSTRTGGASELEGNHDPRKRTEKVLNLGFAEWDTRERVLKNRQNFFAALNANVMRKIGMRQIHSDIVRVANSADAESPVQTAKADALITNEPGLLLTVQVADCVPILLADKKRHAIAAIHSGWRL